MRSPSRLLGFAAAFVALAGAPALAESLGREVTVAAADNLKYLPAMAYNPAHEEFLVVWHDRSGTDPRVVKGARLDRFGKVIERFQISQGAYSAAQPAVAFDLVRDRYLVVWSYDYFGDGSDWDVRGRLVPWNGPAAALSEFPIYEQTDTQRVPQVAYSAGDDEYLVVWNNASTASTNASISFRFVTAAGVPDWAQTLAGDTSHHYLNPSLVYNSNRNEYLVAYERDQTDVLVQRLDYYGEVGSEVAVADWPDQEFLPSVASCPGQNQWLVAWQSNNPVGQIYVRFLFGDATVDGGPLQVTINPLVDYGPKVACRPGSGQYLVVWEQQYSNASGHYGISGRRVATSKEFLAPAFTVRTVWTTQNGDARTPALVGGPIGWSTVWMQDREGTSYIDLHAKMVWGLFADDFESGNPDFWSDVVP